VVLIAEFNSTTCSSKGFYKSVVFNSLIVNLLSYHSNQYIKNKTHI